MKSPVICFSDLMWLTYIFLFNFTTINDINCYTLGPELDRSWLDWPNTGLCCVHCHLGVNNAAGPVDVVGHQIATVELHVQPLPVPPQQPSAVRSMIHDISHMKPQQSGWLLNWDFLLVLVGLLVYLCMQNERERLHICPFYARLQWISYKVVWKKLHFKIVGLSF